MSLKRVIGVRYVAHGTQKIAVLLTRNESGTISGQCLLEPEERPIIDGPTVQSVLRTIEQVMDALLFSRRRTTA